MSSRKVKDAVQNGERIYFRGHAGATYMSDGSTVEEQVSSKVDKVNGKQLTTEDFTTALKTKLEGLYNYDDTEVAQAVETLRSDFDELVSGDTTTAIRTFNEIVAFLEGIEDSQDLDSIIAGINTEIAKKLDKTGGTIDGNLTVNGKTNLVGTIVGKSSKNTTGLYIYPGIDEGTAARFEVMKNNTWDRMGFTLFANGNMGVGTTTDQGSTLNVNGTFNTTGNASVNGLLSANGRIEVTATGNDIASFSSRDGIGIVTLKGNGNYGTRLTIYNSDNSIIIHNLRENGDCHHNGKLTVQGSIATNTDALIKGRIFINDGGEGIYLSSAGINWHGADNGWVASNLTFAKDGYVGVGGGFYVAGNSSIKGSLTIEGNKAWHAGNDGSGSGLDADLLDGKHDGELTAAKLSTPRKIWGQSFDGSGDVRGVAMGLGGFVDIQSNDEINRYGGTLFLQNRGDGSLTGTGEGATGNLVMCHKGGNVGIGAYSPAYKLDVNGDIRSSNSVYAQSFYHPLTGTRMGGSFIEIVGSDSIKTPFIDFHYGGDTSDFTSRIIENTKGVLTVGGALDITKTLLVFGATTLGNSLTVNAQSYLKGGAYVGETGGADLHMMRANGANYIRAASEGGWLTFTTNGQTSRYSLVIDADGNTNVNGLLTVNNNSVYAQGFMIPSGGSYNRTRISTNENGTFIQAATYDGSGLNGTLYLTGYNAENLSRLEIRADSTTISGSLTVGGKSVLVSGGLTKSDVTTALGYTPPTTNTTYSAATTSSDGLMTAAMVTKLNGIAAGANAYSLPAATSSVLGGVKVGSNITVSSGTISLSQSNVTTALGYTPEYISELSVSGDNISLKSKAGTVVNTKTATVSGLSRISRFESYTTATTVASLNVGYRSIYVTLTANASLSASATGATYNGRSVTAYVYTAAARTITIPTTGNYVSMCGSSYTTKAGGWVEFNLTCINGIWHIAKLEQQ